MFRDVVVVQRGVMYVNGEMFMITSMLMMISNEVISTDADRNGYYEQS